MKYLIIVGAGGFGREVYQWAKDAGYDKNEWRIKGFVDDNPGALKPFPHVDRPILGSIEGYPIGHDDHFACAIGLPKVKQACVEKLLARGTRFVTVIHPSAYIGSNVRIGTGCIICPGAILTVDIEVGDFVLINYQSTIGHDARIGKWCSIFGHCDITGHVELGEGVMMGSHASVIPGIQVGDRAVIGAGAVVIRPVLDGVTVAGTFARTLCSSEK